MNQPVVDNVENYDIMSPAVQAVIALSYGNGFGIKSHAGDFKSLRLGRATMNHHHKSAMNSLRPLNHKNTVDDLRIKQKN